MKKKRRGRRDDDDMLPRGTGRIFQKTYRDRQGKIKKALTWSYKWNQGGKTEYVHTGSADRAVAEQALREKMTSIGRGLAPGTAAEKLRYDNLRLILRTDWINKKKNVRRLDGALKHLDRKFGGLRALAITAVLVSEYTSERLAEGAAEATINVELSMLRRMYSLAWKKKAGLLRDHVPDIELLAAENIRQGVITPPQLEEFLSLFRSQDVREMIEVTFITGWRAWSDVCTRQWSHVLWQSNCLELRSGEGKARKRRLFPMPPGSRLRAILERRRAITPDSCPWIFHRFGGRQILSYHSAWRAATKKLKKLHPDWDCENWVRHRLRYSAVDNLLNAGIGSDQVCKMVGMSPKILSRYHQLTERNLAQAGQTYERYLADQRERGTVPDVQRENVLAFASGKKA